MGRVRVFYGHEGIVPPTGLRPRSAAPAPPEVEDAEVDVVETIPGSEDAAPVEIVGELVEDGEVVAPGEIVNVDGTPVPVDEDGIPELQALPDDSWTKGELLAYAEGRGIDMTGATKTKPAALARVLESIEGE